MKIVVSVLLRILAEFDFPNYQNRLSDSMEKMYNDKSNKSDKKKKRKKMYNDKSSKSDIKKKKRKKGIYCNPCHAE